MLALMGSERRSFAAVADASLLKTTLTPFGSERAGNAAGTIPAWTGGMTEIPAGFTWDTQKTLPPDFFADDAMLYEVNSSNMAQYAHLLTEGLQALITKTGFSLQVYPTRRTHAAPQWVYDYIVANVGRAQLAPQGGRLGFTGGYGGIPFPIPDSDPLAAGAQLVYNHEARWGGIYRTDQNSTFTVSSGQVTLVNAQRSVSYMPYYDNTKSLAQYNGYFFMLGGPGQYAPATVAGGQIISYESSNHLLHPDIAWQLLAGQGRVRKAPEVSFDTPSSYADGIINYDEYYGFGQSLEEYDWKYLGTQELLIPYNNNKLFHVDPYKVHLEKFIDPKVLRWELHRVRVVEATLHPGKRNVLARRKLYLDEDTSVIGCVDSWDAGNNLQRHIHLANANFPNLPGVTYLNAFAYDLQTNNYLSVTGQWGVAPYNGPTTFDPVPMSWFNPQAMAASSSY